MKLCPRCKTREVHIRPNGKLAPYCLECKRVYTKEYSLKNRERVLEREKIYRKSEKKKRYDSIRLETNRIYPLKGQLCNFCDESATEHHHYTYPIEVDKFVYTCHPCHTIENRLMKKDPENYLKNLKLKLPFFTLNSEQMGILEKKVEYQSPVEDKTSNYEQLSLF